MGCAQQNKPLGVGRCRRGAAVQCETSLVEGSRDTARRGVTDVQADCHDETRKRHEPVGGVVALPDARGGQAGHGDAPARRSHRTRDDRPQRNSARVRRVGGTVRHATYAEETVARLQYAAARGLPLPIPGAREIRQPHAPAEPLPSDRPAGAQLSTETRLEHERAGGGAAHQRHVGRHRGRLARFWRYLFRPSRSVIGWQPVTTQPTRHR